MNCRIVRHWWPVMLAHARWHTIRVPPNRTPDWRILDWAHIVRTWWWKTAWWWSWRDHPRSRKTRYYSGWYCLDKTGGIDYIELFDTIVREHNFGKHMIDKYTDRLDENTSLLPRTIIFSSFVGIVQPHRTIETRFEQSSLVPYYRGLERLEVW